jgi:hypothetical protein
MCINVLGESFSLCSSLAGTRTITPMVLSELRGTGIRVAANTVVYLCRENGDFSLWSLSNFRANRALSALRISLIN